MASATAALGAAGLSGFLSDGNDEVFGYYQPSADIKVGHFKFDTLAIGTRDDLKKWESRRDRSATYAPVMLIFEDLTGKMVKNDMSGEMEHERVRVLPTAYRIQGNTIAFSGMDKSMGAIGFSGTFDRKRVVRLDAAAGSEAAGSISDADVMRGELRIGSKSWKDVKLDWFGGD